jgi:hypothetical protein
VAEIYPPLEDPDLSGNQKCLPPRHKDTKDFILLFVLSVLVSLWQEEKSFATKSTKFTIKKLDQAFSIDQHKVY